MTAPILSAVTRALQRTGKRQKPDAERIKDDPTKFEEMARELGQHDPKEKP